MSSRLVVDIDPHYPLARGGQFGGQLLLEGGSQLQLTKGQDNHIDVGIFHAGIWIDPEVWREVWIELKTATGAALTGAPLASAAQLAVAGGYVDTTATLANWQAGTERHARVTLDSSDLSSIAAGPVWAIVTVADHIGTDQATVAAGLIKLNAA